MEWVNSLEAALFLELFKLLPVNQQKQLNFQALYLHTHFDQAITQVLSPAVTKTEKEYIFTDDLYGLPFAR